MKVLLLGGGGREHALGWKLAQTASELICAPGNPGLASIASRLVDVDITDPERVTSLARSTGVDLVVIGPEAPLAAGVADSLRLAGCAVFGPNKAAARLESSKAYAKSIMRRAGVPTAAAWTFDNASDALAHLTEHPGPYVVKADGLAAGKGVLVTTDRNAAISWADDCFSGRFGSAGANVVIEEFLEGDEVSVFAICSNGRSVGLQPARDHKRLLDGDAGPNTGGMGAFSPVLDLPDELVEWTLGEVVAPVLETLAADGVEYAGFLYVGLMLTGNGPRVLEFNCRLGDPETEAIMPLLTSDLTHVLHEAASGGTPHPLTWSDDVAVDVVLAAPGYPDNPQKGSAISGIDSIDPSSALVFHAGTAHADGDLVTAGGRVLNVVGIGATHAEARSAAYGAVDQIHFDGMQYRTDIAGGTR
ncbi:MAG: phosphoribosylamine--glycine ligase [Acidimicrobiia bacterium]|nr:phosphoribosylamine--glycine ligase [Acidimicrobiia bacterium]